MAPGFNIPSPEELKLNKPVPFMIQVDNDLLETTKQKLALARYPEEQTYYGPDDWRQGAKVAAVKKLAEYWRDQYAWEKQEAYLNRVFNNFIVKLDVPGHGILILHYTHAKSPRNSAIPLLFSHGWPGSVVKAIKVAGPHPLRRRPRGRRTGLQDPHDRRPGYKTFVTQGGDFDSITRSVATQHPGVVAAQHLNMFPVPPPTLLGEPLTYLRWCLSRITYSSYEQEALRVRDNFERDPSGYLEQQKTRAQTLGFGLGDSPVGLLAWFVEKFHDWGHVEEAFTPDMVITLVMMHWIQGATPGLRFYREAFGERRETEKTFETYVRCPTGVSNYPKEQLHCPKDWAQQAANIQFWREHDVGGHFSSLGCPDLFVQDLRQFFGSPVVAKSMSRMVR